MKNPCIGILAVQNFFQIIHPCCQSCPECPADFSATGILAELYQQPPAWIPATSARLKIRKFFQVFFSRKNDLRNDQAASQRSPNLISTAAH